jgi:hypothetical protein
MRIGSDLAAASAAWPVLTILSGEDSSGYQIVGRLRELSGGELDWADAMAYPLLHRLHRLGYLTAEWREQPDGDRRRYYVLTEEGRTAPSRGGRRAVAVFMALVGVWRSAAWLNAT